jgi:hypothetical protein
MDFIESIDDFYEKPFNIIHVNCICEDTLSTETFFFMFWVRKKRQRHIEGMHLIINQHLIKKKAK